MDREPLLRKLNILPYILGILAIFGIAYFAMFNYLPQQFFAKIQNQELLQGGNRIRLSWTTWGNPGEIKRFEAITRQFNSIQDEITMEMQPLSTGNYDRTLLVDLMAGEAPDVFYASEGLLHMLIRDGKISDMSEHFNEWKLRDDFVPQLVDLARKEDKIYGIPVDFNIPVLYFNEDKFRNKGLKTPLQYYREGQWDWDHFRSLAYGVTSPGRNKETVGMVMENWWGLTYPWIYQNGGMVFDQDNHCVINSDKAKEAIQYFKNMIDEGSLLYVANEKGNLPHTQLFKQQKAAMITAGRWVLPDFKSSIQDFEWDIVPVPKGPGGNKVSSITTAFICINANSRNKNEAWKFIEYFTGWEGQKFRLLNEGNAIPSLRSLLPLIIEEERSYDYQSKTYFEDLSSAITIPKVQIIYPEVGKTIDERLEQIWLNRTDVDTVLDKLEKDVNQIIEAREREQGKR